MAEPSECGALASAKTKNLTLDKLPAHGVGLVSPTGEDQNRRFRLLVESIKDYAIIMLDPAGRVTTWNEGADRILGLAANEVVGRDFAIFYPCPDVSSGRPVRILETAALAGRSEEEGWLLRNGKSQFWANLVVTAIHDEGAGLRGFGVVVRDRTEGKTHETELLQKNAALETAVDELDAFSYSVSHDLRAPLRAINGFSRILLEDGQARCLSNEAIEHLKVIREKATQMGCLIDDLLAFSKVGRATMRREIVDTASLAARVLQDFQSEKPDVNVRVGQLPAICGDPGLFKQVLTNLVSNAFKYTQTRPDPKIEIGSIWMDGEQVIFVRDNGVGFDMQYSDKLFGVFQRLHRSEDFEGTGVGLALAQRILARHGQRIWAVAEVGKGATFYFTVEPSFI